MSNQNGHSTSAKGVKRNLDGRPKKMPKKHQFSVLHGVLPIDPARLPLEVVAGVTLAALAIPEVMGYTSVAGTPVVTGLYTIFAPIVVFAVLGSSRHLVVGADSATAAILGAGLVGLAAAESPTYGALASLAALVTSYNARAHGVNGETRSRSVPAKPTAGISTRQGQSRRARTTASHDCRRMHNSQPDPRPSGKPMPRKKPKLMMRFRGCLEAAV